jgi:CBS domain-containing protein
MQRKIIPDVISGDRELTAVPPAATVAEACRLMRERNIGSVLVLVEGALEGIFTERDVVHRVVAAGRDPNATEVSAVMTRQPDTIDADSTAIEALRLMHFGGYRHLPVMSKGQLVGVVSRRDFFGAEKARLDDETELWERL